MPNKNKVIIFAGTDTVFTPGPTGFRTHYERGETLSYAAQVLVQIFNENEEVTRQELKNDALEALSYSSSSVAFINGPATLGYQSGHRIAQGLSEVFKAIAEGSDVISILAHSRGAAQAVLLVHEIERIKTALKDDSKKDLSVKDIITDSPNDKTSTGIKYFFTGFFNNKMYENPEQRTELIKSLDALKINPFLMDPVPGDSYLKVGKWLDVRFAKPLNVNEYVCLVARDERSACFSLSLPENIKPTEIPGNHSTASGNRYSQKLTAPLIDGNTTGVQDLTLLKIFTFLDKVMGKLNLGLRVLDTKHPQLDKLLNEFLNADEDQRREKLVSVYLEVAKNNEAYRSFTKLSYSLGLGPAPDGSRYLHDPVNGATSTFELGLDKVGPFINEEHQRMSEEYIRRCIGGDVAENMSPLEKSAYIKEALKRVIDDMTPEFEVQMDFVEAGAKLDIKPKEVIVSPLFKIITGNPESASLFFNVLSTIVDSIGVKYLENYRDMNNKAQFLESINEILLFLRTAAKNAAISDFHKILIKQCSDILETGLLKTINDQYKNTLCQLIFLKSNRELEPEQYLQKAQELYEILSNLIQSYEPLKKLMSEGIDFSFNTDKLENERTLLLHNVAQRLCDTHYDLRNKPDGLDDAFYQKVKNLAIALGATSPERQDLIHELEAQKRVAQGQLLELQRALAAQAAQIAGLENERPIVQAHVDELQRALAARAVEIAALENERPIVQAHVDELQQSLVTQAAEITRLENEMRLVQAQVDELQAALSAREADFGQIEVETEAQKARADALQIELDVQARKLYAQTQQYNSQAGSAAAYVINNKLLPLTEAYLLHLLKEAKRYQSTIDETAFEQAMPENSDRLEQSKYDKLRDKILKIQSLHKVLKDTTLGAAQRVEIFGGVLKREKALISKHRDPEWQIYLRNCLFVLASIVSGIVPSVVMAAYACSKGRSPFFFAQSQGQAYVDEARQLSAMKLD